MLEGREIRFYVTPYTRGIKWRHDASMETLPPAPCVLLSRRTAQWRQSRSIDEALCSRSKRRLLRPTRRQTWHTRTKSRVESGAGAEVNASGLSCSPLAVGRSLVGPWSRRTARYRARSRAFARRGRTGRHDSRLPCTRLAAQDRDDRRRVGDSGVSRRGCPAHSDGNALDLA